MIGQRKLVIPKPGLVIRDPGNRRQKLAATGRVVVVDEFWLRRIADGDVEVSDPPARKPRGEAPPAAETTAAAQPATPSEPADDGAQPESGSRSLLDRLFHPHPDPAASSEP
jgi:hypothetical protein